MKRSVEMSLSLSAVALPWASGFQWSGPSGEKTRRPRPAAAAAASRCAANDGDPFMSMAITGRPRWIWSPMMRSIVVDLPAPLAPTISACAASWRSDSATGRPDGSLPTITCVPASSAAARAPARRPAARSRAGAASSAPPATSSPAATHSDGETITASHRARPP